MYTPLRQMALSRRSLLLYLTDCIAAPFLLPGEERQQEAVQIYLSAVTLCSYL